MYSSYDDLIENLEVIRTNLFQFYSKVENKELTEKWSILLKKLYNDNTKEITIIMNIDKSKLYHIKYNIKKISDYDSLYTFTGVFTDILDISTCDAITNILVKLN